MLLSPQLRYIKGHAAVPLAEHPAATVFYSGSVNWDSQVISSLSKSAAVSIQQLLSTPQAMMNIFSVGLPFSVILALTLAVPQTKPNDADEGRYSACASET